MVKAATKKTFLKTSLSACCAAALLSGLFAPSALARGRDTLSNIREAVARGSISAETGTVEALKALFDPQNVDRNLKSPALPTRSDCASMLFRGAMAKLPSMSPEGQALARSVIGQRVSAATLPTLPNIYYTQHFQIEWGNDIPLSDIDGTVPAPDLDANGTPDVIQRWADYLEYSYSTLGDLGFPVGLTGPKMRIVIANTSNIPEYTLSTGFFGVTYHMTDGRIWIAFNSSYAGFGLDNDDPVSPYYGAMKVTAVHEFFHAVQYKMLPEAWATEMDDWWLEASSVWSEEKAFDDVNDYYAFWGSISDSWIENQERSLPIFRPYGTEVYERGLFPIYLDEHAGGPSAVKRVWDIVRGGKRILYTDSGGKDTANSALEQFALEKGVIDQNGAGDVARLYTGFAAANAAMDYEEGFNYAMPALRSSASLATGGTISTNPPEYMGATFRRESDLSGPLRLFVSGSPANNWGVSATVKRGSPAYFIELASNESDGTASVQFDAVYPTDEIFCAPSYLKAGEKSNSYEVRKNYLVSPPNGTATPSLNPAEVVVAPVQAGISLSWQLPSAPQAGGTVIMWQKASGGSWKSKTVIAPLREAVIGGLEGETNYNVKMWLYDNRGIEGPSITMAATSGDPAPPIPTAPKGSAPSSGGSSEIPKLDMGCFIESVFTWF